MSDETDGGQQLLTALTTEHFTLQGARAQTLAESSSRATVYVGAVSSSLVALGFIGQVSEVGAPFRVFALVVLPTLYALGVVTHIRIVECGVEDVRYGMAINRIRGYYRELAGEQARLFLLNGHDDARGVFENAGVPAGRRPQVFSFATVVALIEAVVGGSAVGIVVAAAADVPLGVAAVSGVVAGLVSLAIWLRVAARILSRRTPQEPPLYPTTAGARRRGRFRRRRDDAVGPDLRGAQGPGVRRVLPRAAARRPHLGPRREGARCLPERA